MVTAIEIVLQLAAPGVIARQEQELQSQRQEIARLRAENEKFYARIAEMETENFQAWLDETGPPTPEPPQSPLGLHNT